MSTMIGSFKFRGVDSSEFNLVCRSIKRPLLPPMKVNQVEMPVRSGVFDFGGNDYGTREVRMSIAYIGDDYFELRRRARSIASWLSCKTWAPLLLNDEPDKYYLARIIDEVELHSLWESGVAEIPFICQPYAYFIKPTSNIEDMKWDDADVPWEVHIPLLGLQSFTFSTNEPTIRTFNNPGTNEINFKSPQGSKNDMKITGSWSSITIIVNNKSIVYNIAGSGELIIDSINMEVKLNNNNILHAIDGDLDYFLEIKPGENLIEIQGTNLDVNVTIDFVPMWI